MPLLIWSARFWITRQHLYPNVDSVFTAQKNAADAIHFAGFDYVTLANNHFCDYGEVGVKNTLHCLE